MAVIRLFLCGLAALIISGCGQTVTETLHIPETTPGDAACNETIVLLPFADYSYAENIGTAHSRNMAIMEALTDRLAAKGFQVPVQEDVFKYLVDGQIINLVPYGKESRSASSGSLQKELDEGDWSDMMKNEFRGLIESQEDHAASDDSDPLAAPGVHGLDNTTIMALGKKFGAGYVVRGRIINYEIGRENSWDPTKRGLLPFVYGATSKTVFGIAKSEKYDNLDAMALGALAGGLIGNNADNPLTPATSITNISGTTTTTSSSGTSNASTWNSIIWGAVGAGAGHLAQNGGDTPQALVHLRLWVQDSASGEVIWTNRAEVKVSPESVFADSAPQALFDTAVDKAVAALVDDFWSKAKVRL